MSAAPAPEVQREIGRIIGAEAGPSVVVVAAIHGNEPAGVLAAQSVLKRLGEGHIPVRGELVALVGNVAAMQAQKRFLQRDLNRSWSAAQLARLHRESPESLQAEDREQCEILAALDAVQARARGPAFLTDLHTSSAPGVPFVLFGATQAQRDFVRAFPIPVIGGIVEQVEGVLSEFATTRGFVSCSVEGGQHTAPASRHSLEAVVWLSLVQAGAISADLPEVRGALEVLDALRGDLPRVVQVVSRYAITAEDAFVMEAGFRNIDRIHKGQLLARDRRGEVRAAEDGVVVLPLYQKLGNDGFFWGREVAAPNHP